MESEIQEIGYAEIVTRSEIDMQIATAKRYPRDISACLAKIKDIATMDTETADSCFYALKRRDKKGKEVLIEGPSIRLAEIIAMSWGNLRIQSRVVAQDAKTITAQGVCHDLETNNAVSVEIMRSTTNSQGLRYSNDMVITTGNAAAAIAFRNAVLKIVPAVVIKKVIDDVKAVSRGKVCAPDLDKKRQNAIIWFERQGVSKELLFEYLDITNVEYIDNDMLFELSGLKNAIKEGATTIEDSIVATVQARRNDFRSKEEEEVHSRKDIIRENRDKQPEMM